MNNEQQITDSPVSLEPLKEQLSNQKADIEVFRKVWHAILDVQVELQQLTEYALSINIGNKDWQRLLIEMKGSNISNLMDKLNRTGFALRKNKELRKAFDMAAFRLLEQTRSGKQDDVYYGLLRIFIAQKQNVPGNLVTAFKYKGNTFKVLIFAFLSGVLGKEEIE